MRNRWWVQRGFSTAVPLLERKNFYGLTFDELSAIVTKDLELDVSFATRLWSTVYQKGVYDFDNMRLLPVKLRDAMVARFVVATPSVKSDSIAEDGTRKLALRMHDNAVVESVYIPDSLRGTACVDFIFCLLLFCSFSCFAFLAFCFHHHNYIVPLLLRCLCLRGARVVNYFRHTSVLIPLSFVFSPLFVLFSISLNRNNKTVVSRRKSAVPWAALSVPRAQWVPVGTLQPLKLWANLSPFGKRCLISRCCRRAAALVTSCLWFVLVICLFYLVCLFVANLGNITLMNNTTANNNNANIGYGWTSATFARR